MSDRLAALVAAEWAANRFKTDNPDKLRQVSLGSLVVDICPDGLVAGGFITDLLSGNNRLLGSSGNIVTADNIRGFVDHTGEDDLLLFLCFFILFSLITAVICY